MSGQQDEWETDESDDDDDLYEVVEDALSQSCPQASYMDTPPLPARTVPSWRSGGVPSLPMPARRTRLSKGKVVGSDPQLSLTNAGAVPPLPIRNICSGSKGELDLSQKVPPPRPPPPLYPRGSKSNLLEGLAPSTSTPKQEVSSVPALPSRNRATSDSVTVTPMPSLPPRQAGLAMPKVVSVPAQIQDYVPSLPPRSPMPPPPRTDPYILPKAPKKSQGAAGSVAGPDTLVPLPGAKNAGRYMQCCTLMSTRL